MQQIPGSYIKKIDCSAKTGRREKEARSCCSRISPRMVGKALTAAMCTVNLTAD